MANYELYSTRNDDLENPERDIFAPKSRTPEDAELVVFGPDDRIRRPGPWDAGDPGPGVTISP